MIAFIDDHCGSHGVEPICEVLPIAPSTRHVRAARLGATGGVLMRASRIEPLIRVMPEAEDQAEMHATVDGLASLIRARAAAGAKKTP